MASKDGVKAYMRQAGTCSGIDSNNCCAADVKHQEVSWRTMNINEPAEDSSADSCLPPQALITSAGECACTTPAPGHDGSSVSRSLKQVASGEFPLVPLAPAAACCHLQASTLCPCRACLAFPTPLRSSRLHLAASSTDRCHQPSFELHSRVREATWSSPPQVSGHCC